MTREQTKTGRLSRVLSREMAVFVSVLRETWNIIRAQMLSVEFTADNELSQIT